MKLLFLYFLLLLSIAIFSASSLYFIFKFIKLI